MTKGLKMKSFLQKSARLFAIWTVEISLLWVVSIYTFDRLTESPEDNSGDVLVEKIYASLEATKQLSEIDYHHDPNEIEEAPMMLFMTGTSQKQVLSALGEPVWRKPGFWNNSVAWSYENLLSSEIDLGFLFDKDTKRLRQAEIAVPPSIELETIYAFLDALLYHTPAEVEEKLAKVYWRESNSQSFQVNNLEAVIQRNDADRIYIGVWEKDFH